MQKPPPLFRPLESLRFAATPRMFRGLLVLALAVLIPTGADKVLRPDPPRAGPIPLPVPVQEWTTETHGWSPMQVLFNTLPAPDPRQKGVECRKALGQVMLEGACWQLLPVPPPCPTEEGAFEHDKDHKCYVRVLRAERPKQSGDPAVVNIAGEP